jgi:hypothetical protein
MKFERWQKLHSFANFGLWVSLCDLQMFAMCMGLPQLSRSEEVSGQKLIFSCTNFLSKSQYFLSVFSKC